MTSSYDSLRELILIGEDQVKCSLENTADAGKQECDGIEFREVGEKAVNVVNVPTSSKKPPMML